MLNFLSLSFHSVQFQPILYSCGYPQRQVTELLRKEEDNSAIKKIRASSASIRIFKKHDWNNVESGWSGFFQIVSTTLNQSNNCESVFLFPTLFLSNRAFHTAHWLVLFHPILSSPLLALPLLFSFITSPLFFSSPHLISAPTYSTFISKANYTDQQILEIQMDKNDIGYFMRRALHLLTFNVLFLPLPFYSDTYGICKVF